MSRGRKVNVWRIGFSHTFSDRCVSTERNLITKAYQQKLAIAKGGNFLAASPPFSIFGSRSFRNKCVGSTVLHLIRGLECLKKRELSDSGTIRRVLLPLTEVPVHEIASSQ
jgi:hypothetical protein